MDVSLVAPLGLPNSILSLSLGVEVTVIVQFAVNRPSWVVTITTAVPAATAVTTPDVETVATDVLLVDQATFLLVALEGCTVATSGSVCPIPMVVVDLFKVTPVTGTETTGSAAAEEFWGAGEVRTTKLEALLLSSQPLPLPSPTVVGSVPSLALRSMLAVLLGAGALPEPSYWLALVPKPTKSITLAPVGPVTVAVVLARATLALVPDMLMLPVASGVGKL
ncbi:MAG: hypothetical protein P4L49_12840 [Desulfosporosinus sp.]|nr:hypothetical protein [Desulfosporosinus sp.]